MRSTEQIREALAWWENEAYMELSEPEEDHVRELAGAARELLALLESDALIIRRDAIDYEAAAKIVRESWDRDLAWSSDAAVWAIAVVDAALASSQGQQ